MSQIIPKNLPVNIPEYLPQEIYNCRIEMINEYEKGSQFYVNEFDQCYICNVKIWIGRSKILSKQNPYYFDDYYYFGWSRLCHKCCKMCFCTHPAIYKIETSFCQLCNKTICRKHGKMAKDSVCADCFESFIIGAKVVELLKTSKTKTVDELYRYLKSRDV